MLAATDVERMLTLAGQRYGEPGVASVRARREMMAQAANQPDTTKLKLVNDFFNRRVRFGEDIDIRGQNDHWGTPLETLGRGAGDCEDFAIGKYITLKHLGMPTDKLRLTYVRVRIGGPQSTIVQAHMVLSYYAQPGDEPAA